MPRRVAGYQQSLGFVDDATLHDGDDVQSTSNSGAGTGYAQTGAVGGTVAVTGLLDLGLSVLSVKNIRYVVKYANLATILVEWSDDRVIWSSVGLAAGASWSLRTCAYAAFYGHHDVSVGTLNHRYWRLSILDDASGNACTAQVAIQELWAVNGGGVTLTDYAIGEAIMGVQGVINPANMVFPKGYLTGTIQGGGAEAIIFGELQDFTVKETAEIKAIMGPESLYDVAKGIGGMKCVVSAKYAKIKIAQFVMLRGGTATYSSPINTLTVGIAQQPLVFNLHYKSPADGSDAEMIIYGGICNDWELPLKLNDWSIPGFNAEFSGDGTNIYKIMLPDSQVTS